MLEQRINKYLKQFGLTENGKPRYRLVWSDDQLEHRRGEFNEFYGHVLLRTTIGVREVPKYPFVQHRWVLECWVPPHASFNSELPNACNGTYEPLYVFEDSEGLKLPLCLSAVELIMGVMTRPRSAATRRNEQDDREAARDKTEQANIEDELEVSCITNALHMKEGIVRP